MGFRDAHWTPKWLVGGLQLASRATETVGDC